MPRELCLVGRPVLIWGLFTCNLVVWAAYMAIPLTLRYIRRRVGSDMPEPGLVRLFGTFISFCGWSHFAGASVIWWGFWRLELTILALTAAVSCLSAVLLYFRRGAIIEGLRAFLRFRTRVLAGPPADG